MKKILLSCVAVLAVITIAGCSNSTVATTKAGKVTQDDLYESMKESAGPAALQKLILKDVLEENYGKDVTDKKINAEFDKQKKSYGEQFDTLLKQANLTEKSYKDTIRMNLLVESAVKANTKFTDADYKKAWEDWTPKMTAQHILVADEAAAKDLIAKINAGEDFDTLAKENSLDTGSKEDGGKLPEFDATTGYDPAFVAAAAKLKDGEVTAEPVQGQNGYHIIKMIKNPEKGNMKDHKKDLEKSMLDAKLKDNEYIQSVLAKLVKKADVKIKDEDLKDVMDSYTGKSSDKKDNSTKKESTDKKESTK